MEGLTLEVPNTRSMVHLDAPSYLVILTDCSIHWTPLLSPSPRVLIFIQISELVHPGFSGRAKISRGKYVKRLLLVDGGICPQKPVPRDSPTQIPLFSYLRCPVGKHCFCPWKFQI